MSNKHNRQQKRLFLRSQADLERSIQWSKEYISELEDVLETDIPIQDQSDFKTVKEIKAAIKETYKSIDDCKKELELIES